MTAENRAAPTEVAEQEPQGQRPIDRLRQLLEGTDHREFLTPDGQKKIIVSTWQYAERMPDIYALKHEGEVIVMIGPPQARMAEEFQQSDEYFHIQQDRIEADFDAWQPFMVHSLLGFDFEGDFPNPITVYCNDWQGENYDKLINNLLQVIERSTPLTPPAQ